MFVESDPVLYSCYSKNREFSENNMQAFCAQKMENLENFDARYTKCNLVGNVLLLKEPEIHRTYKTCYKLYNNIMELYNKCTLKHFTFVENTPISLFSFRCYIGLYQNIK